MKQSIASLLVEHGLTISVSDGRRIVTCGKVTLNGQEINDPSRVVDVQSGDILTVGKKTVKLP